MKTEQGSTIPLIFDSLSDTQILTVKARIYEKEGIPPSDQRLMFAGRQLDNGYTLSNYNIQEKSILDLLLSPQEGNCMGKT